jgi:hypothetical protein
MKYATLLLFLAALCGCATRKKVTIQGTDDFSYLQHWKRTAAGAGLMAISGACYGVHETVVHHPDRIPESWNRQWWDGRVSWTNKGTTTWGKTFGSFGSDAKHTFGPVHRWTMYSGAVVLTIGRPRPWWHYGLDALVSFTAFSLGFHATYDLYFHQ